MTVRGRVGVPFGMLRTGGLAVTNLKASVVFVGDPVTNVAAAGISETRTGWTAGGGVEWAFARNWSVKAEYLYADFGSVSFVSAFNVDPDFTHTHTVHPTAQIVRAGVNYKFDWMGR